MPKFNFSLLFLLFFVLANISCKKHSTLFEQVPQSISKVTFENTLTETEKLNILSYEYFYNGGGVATGDFNNDGKIDLYFAGNQVDNKLYLNNTQLENPIEFKEIKCGISGKKEGWKTGVTIVDINNDGWLDIYQCYSGIGTSQSRKNELFINQGGKNGVWSMQFKEEADRYGIADMGYSTQAAFFDYDIDGDMDLFVLNHNLKGYERKEAAFMKVAIDSLAGDRLYRNEGQRFIDVTQQAGIKSNPLGFGLGLSITDLNNDNLPDIYVANDYVEEDYIYINQGNGIFKEVGKQSMGHFSYSSMGVDAADVNNDGLMDIFTADMLPEDPKREKLLAFPDNWNVQKSMLENGFHWQNMRNMLQINQGNFNGTPKFAELGQLAGVAATDWSWAPLFADFDNDGQKDLFVSNGFVKDLTNLDFVKYFMDQETRKNQNLASETLLKQVKKMPSTATHHYIFKNNGDLTFTNKVVEWGFEQNTIGSGAIYADLDNDGDLEIITNNTNEPAKIYNNYSEIAKNQFVNVRLKSKYKSGAKVFLYANKKMQLIEQQANHGFQSAIDAALHFGLGPNSKVDSLIIVWPNGKKTKIGAIKANSLLEVGDNNATFILNENTQKINNWPTIFSETQIIDFLHKENNQIDFNRQILLPKFYSNIGPKLIKGDANNDGLEDIFICSNQSQNSCLYFQLKNGKFQKSDGFRQLHSKQSSDIDALLADIDLDSDLDLIIIKGGYEATLEAKSNEDELFINDGKGNFLKGKNKFPTILTNKSSIVKLDADKDNDIDLFIVGGVRAGLYPFQDPSYLLKNDGKGNFRIAQKFETDIITAATVADIDHDNFPEIIVVGEFCPIKILKNTNGKLDSNKSDLIPNSAGWYSSITSDDLDNDGDIDFVIGNLGQNTALKASSKYPLQIHFADFDNNGTIDPIMSKYSNGKANPIAGRDELLEQIPALRKKYTDYESYSNTSITELLESNFFAKNTTQKIENLASGIIWNNNGSYIWENLPIEAQFAPINSILVKDFNNDNYKDLLLLGNNAKLRIRIGKTDANYGQLFLGNKRRKFVFERQSKTNLYLQGDIKSALLINKQVIFGVNNERVISATFK
jgi:enediyne biosynthesis protein E4